MARYTGPVCKLCRREGQKLMLKGQKCYTEKCPIERRQYPPGQHGPAQARRRKQSDYAVQLREKQKVKRTYGLPEKQFRSLFEYANHIPGVTGEISVKPKSKNIFPIEAALEARTRPKLPEWLALDEKQRTGRMVRTPMRADIDASIQEQLIVELYSK